MTGDWLRCASDHAARRPIISGLRSIGTRHRHRQWADSAEEGPGPTGGHAAVSADISAGEFNGDGPGRGHGRRRTEGGARHSQQDRQVGLVELAVSDSMMSLSMSPS